VDMVMIILSLRLLCLLTFDVDMGQCSALCMLVLVCRYKHSTWLKLKWLKY
jgi:hypothetical protein